MEYPALDAPSPSLRRESADLSCDLSFGLDLELEREFLEPTYTEGQYEPPGDAFSLDNSSLIERLRDISPLPLHPDEPKAISLPQWTQEQASINCTEPQTSDLELKREFLVPTYTEGQYEPPDDDAFSLDNSSLIERLRDISPLPLHPDEPKAISLPQWIQEQASINCTEPQTSHNQRAATIAKVKVAYAISKLLEHIKVAVSNYSQTELQQLCSLENFSIETFHDMFSGQNQIVAVDMISPYMSVQFENNIKIDITRHCDFCCATKAVMCQDELKDDNLLCHSFGVLLYNLFCGQSLSEDRKEPPASIQELDGHEQLPPSKKIICMTCAPSLSSYTTTSVSRLVNSLLDCQLAAEVRPEDAYISLEIAIGDLELLLKEPSVFLFDYENRCLNTHTSSKLYGRKEEMSALSAAFCRVALSGKSEALMIGGYSGSGKTQLVLSSVDSVVAANGILVTAKFEEISSPLAVVLSAFNDLCVLLAARMSAEESQRIFERLEREFDQNLPLLVSTLPNVLRLASPQTNKSMRSQDYCGAHGSEVNFVSLCDIIARFMRIVATQSCPILLALDDCQWSDSVSLGIVHAVLSDKEGASTALFVGTYRDNIPPTHIVFGFCGWLSKFNVSLSTINLIGMNFDEVNSMVSDSLGIFPRLCESLSQVILRKTSGNPFFVKTFLWSLVDQHLLVYSLREMQWQWNLDKIISLDITPNVLDLLSAKLNNLSGSIQTAIKVASCFGIKMNAEIVHDISSNAQYSSLKSYLNQAVEDGLLDLEDDGSYRFVHDRVREASYDMIDSRYRSRFHFYLGMILFGCRGNRKSREKKSLFAMLDQIKHGVPSLLQNESERISIAELYYDAGIESFRQSNYTMGYQYAKTAISLLSNDSWKRHFDLSLRLHCLLSKTAYAYRRFEEAKEASIKVEQYSSTLQMKLDAYDIQHSIIFIDPTPNEVVPLIDKMIDLIKSLGEEIPDDDTARKKVFSQISSTMKSFAMMSDENLVQIHQTKSQHHADIMRAYYILTSLVYLAKPTLHPYYASRWVQYSVEHKVASKYVPASYTCFAAILCQQMNENSRIGQRIGQLGLKLLNRSGAPMSELPLVHMLYYGYVGVLFEPIQAVIEMHRKAGEIARQIGNLSISALHKIFQVAREFYAGTNLLKWKTDIERDLKEEEYRESFQFLRRRLKLYCQAVTTLIGGSQPPNLVERSDGPLWDSEPSCLLIEMTCLTYLGYFERVHHMGKLWEQNHDAQQSEQFYLRRVYVYFYYGLAALSISRRKKTKSSNVDRIISVVKNAACYNSWNYRNKALLLVAEQYSVTLENARAEATYTDAISAAQESKFLHEEGLACELAGMHYERLNKIQQAVTLFLQAEKCYNRWGSQMKVQKMKDKAKNLRS